MSIEEETKRCEAYSSRAHNAGSHGAKLGTGKARARLYQHHKLQMRATAEYHGGDYEPEFYPEQRRLGHHYDDPTYQRGCDYNTQAYYGGQYGYEGSYANWYGGSQSVRNQHSRFPTQSGNSRKKR